MSDEAIDESDEVDEADEEDGPTNLVDDLIGDSPDDPAAPRSQPRCAVLLCGAAATVAMVFAIVSALSWWGDVRDAASTDASARDAVLSQARIDVATVNTLDYHDPTGSLQQWSAVTTAALHQQITQGLTSVTKEVMAAKVSTKGVVLAAAVTALDVEHGTATVIVSVQLTKTPDAGNAVVDRNRVKASMVRVGSVWKLADLSAVAVQLR